MQVVGGRMTFLFWITLGVGGLWGLLFARGLRDLGRTPRVGPADALGDEPLPRVSVVVPARDEETSIEACLRSLSAQTHEDLEIIVVDDDSADRTAEIVTGLAAADARIRLVRLRELPPGWTGKCHALHQGVRQGNARGEWLLFTDADTVHHPASVAAALRVAIARGVDLVTLVPHLSAGSFWERLMQPTVAALIALFKRPARINDPELPDVFANGQFMLVRREAYERAGGHQAVRGKVLDDTELARSVVRAGGRMWIALARELFATRMYEGLTDLVRGWTKNFYMILGSRPGRVLLAATTALVLSLWPAVSGLAALAGLITGADFWPAAWQVAALAVYLVVLAFQAILRGLNRWYPACTPLAPLANLVAVVVLLRSAWLHRGGRAVSWKGRDVFDDQGGSR
jgi:glycosyltransferase involved in cell wall biosynthesis